MTQHAQRVAGRQLQADITGNRYDRLELDLRMTHCQRNGQRVVNTGVDVQNNANHVASG